MRLWRAAAALAVIGCAGAASRTAPTPATDGAAEAKPSRHAADQSRLPIIESFIGNVPVHQSAEVPEGDVEIAIAGFSGTDYGELGRRAAGHPLGNGRIRVALARLTNASDPAVPQHTRCTFLIDCDEPAVIDVADQAKAKIGARPTASALAAFVDEYVTNKSLARAMDLPSQTAVSRSGDCTEHAFLFVALARRFQYAARDVSGFVLIARAGEPPREAFGHAWAEVHDGKRWRRIDPALGVGQAAAEIDPTTVTIALAIDESGKKAPYELRYVPLRVRREEGPGYERDNERGLTGIHIASLWWHASG